MVLELLPLSKVRVTFLGRRSSCGHVLNDYGQFRLENGCVLQVAGIRVVQEGNSAVLYAGQCKVDEVKCLPVVFSVPVLRQCLVSAGVHISGEVRGVVYKLTHIHTEFCDYIATEFLLVHVDGCIREVSEKVGVGYGVQVYGDLRKEVLEVRALETVSHVAFHDGADASVQHGKGEWFPDRETLAALGGRAVDNVNEAKRYVICKARPGRRKA